MDLIPEIHKKLLAKRVKGSLTVHYDGKGNAVPEGRLMADAMIELFTDKKQHTPIVMKPKRDKE